jgi:DNA-binding FrmR family transcriptional regulator
MDLLGTGMGITTTGVYVAHTIANQEQLLNRVRRIRGQVAALERAIEQEKGCADVLHLIVAARGAMNSLMGEIIADHIRMHVVDPARERDRSRAQGAEELIDIVQAYLK